MRANISILCIWVRTKLKAAWGFTLHSSVRISSPLSHSTSLYIGSVLLKLNAWEELNIRQLWVAHDEGWLKRKHTSLYIWQRRGWRGAQNIWIFCFHIDSIVPTLTVNLLCRCCSALSSSKATAKLHPASIPSCPALASQQDHSQVFCRDASPCQLNSSS